MTKSLKNILSNHSNRCGLHSKGMGKGSQKRSLRFESLENRALLAVMAGFSPAPTEGYVVTTLADVVDSSDDVLSLREAITSAGNGAVITFDASLAGGTISLSQGEFYITKNLTIDASDLWNTEENIPGITIDAHGESRVFDYKAYEGTAPNVLIGLTITNGVYAELANFGGNIWNYSGALTLKDCVISNGQTPYGGGGLYNQTGTLIISGCVFSGNKAGDMIVNGKVTTGNGGAIQNVAGEMTITDSIFVGNSASWNGGAIYNTRATSTFTNVLVVGNDATERDGGGIFLGGDVKIVQSTIAGNTSGRNGGGLYVKYASLKDPVTHEETVTNNLLIQNSIIAENVATTGGTDIYLEVTSAGLFNPITAQNVLSSYDAWDESENTLVFDGSAPLFVDAEGGNFDLTDNSIAINVGNNDYAVYPDGTAMEKDLAGNDRIVDEIIDLGVYEYHPKPVYVVTTLEDVVDPSDGLLSLREAISIAQADEIITFDVSLAGGTIYLTQGEFVVTTKNLTIDASDLWNVEENIPGITIDAHEESRIFNFKGYEGTAPNVLIGLTITNGVYAELANFGGNIWNYSGALTLKDCVISNGQTPYGGGGLYNQTGTLIISGCVFSGNKAGDMIVNGKVTTGNGGAIQNVAGEMTITDSIFIGNSATWNGGAIYNTRATSTFTNVLVVGNDATERDGGGIFLGGDVKIVQSTIAGNTSGRNGGGLYVKYASLKDPVTHEETVTNNLLIQNSIIAENVATTGGTDVYLEVTSAGLFNPITAQNVLSSYDAWDESENTLIFDGSAPLFVDAEGGNFDLTDNSIAINVGNNDYAVYPDGTAMEKDLAGNNRIVDEIIDLGGYECQNPAPLVKLATPENVTVTSAGANRQTVAWDAVENATAYELTASTDQGEWSLKLTDTRWTVTGLTYGTTVSYSVKALGDDVSYSDSDASEVVSLNVCPMDINGDRIVSGSDVTVLSLAYFSRPSSANWNPAADIDGSGMVNGSDLTWLSANWLKRSGDSDLMYPAEKAFWADSDQVEELFDAVGEDDVDFSLDEAVVAPVF